MSAGSICVREVDLADVDESAQAAAVRMRVRKVGTLVILNDAKIPIGILTDRDLAVRVLSEGRDADRTTVKEIMTLDPKAASVDDSIGTVLAMMRAGEFRRLPLVDHDGRLAGLLSLDDILGLLTEEFNEIGSLLQKESPDSLR